MRTIILDTETTGLYASQGHRIIEIGCVEIVNRRFTGRTFHHHFNPHRDIDPQAIAVHGITSAFLDDKPDFQELSDEFISFVRDAEIVIHNASFDVAFLNREFELLSMNGFESYISSVVDTLALAKTLHPGKRNNLDMLCERYGVSRKNRTLHGALIDAQLLGEVYLAMTRGQDSLLSANPDENRPELEDYDSPLETFVMTAEDNEIASHNEFLQSMENAIWNDR